MKFGQDMSRDVLRHIESEFLKYLQKCRFFLRVVTFQVEYERLPINKYFSSQKHVHMTTFGPKIRWNFFDIGTRALTKALIMIYDFLVYFIENV